MINSIPDIIIRNPKIDTAVVARYLEIAQKMPLSAHSKTGADYGITPPFAKGLVVSNDLPESTLKKL